MELAVTGSNRQAVEIFQWPSLLNEELNSNTVVDVSGPAPVGATVVSVTAIGANTLITIGYLGEGSAPPALDRAGNLGVAIPAGQTRNFGIKDGMVVCSLILAAADTVGKLHVSFF